LKKELRRQIKQDEFAGWLEHSVAWVNGHREQVRNGGLALAVVVAAVAGLAWLQQSRAHAAARAFAEALDVFEAPVEAELPPGTQRPAGQVFASGAEKYRTAAAAFDGIDRKYGSTALGLRARYYAALCRVELGEKDQAEKVLADVASRKDDKALEPALARLALADLLRRSGQVDKAVDAYTQLAADASFPLPRDHALMSLARTLEAAGRVPEARKAYRRLTEEFPGSVYAAEARRRATFLEATAQG